MDKRETEEEIKREFLTGKHFEALSRLIVHEPGRSNQGKLNIIVSFRQAGAGSVRMLAAGAGAKPHEILDKSIKPERLRGNFTEEELRAVPNIDRLYGLVSYPDDIRANLNIGGVYLTGVGVEYFAGHADGHYEVVRNGKKSYLKVKGRIVEFIDSFTTLDGNVLPAESYARWFISGDYDIHDLICLSGSSRHPVPSDSPEEAEFLTKMNDAMTGNDKWAKRPAKFVPDEFEPIQHGPQYNYIVYTYHHEPDVKINEQVAQIDCPVAVCDKNGWRIIRRAADLVDYYEKNAVKVKELWKLTDEGERYLKQIANKSFYEYMDEITGRKGGRL